jgi:putative RNA 2'-phosphotransferase
VLQVDTRGMVAAGLVFYRSENDVWLTDHVPARFLSADSKAG